MATQKKIPHTKKSTKRTSKARKEQPLPAGLIERAAERVGYNPAGLAPEEQAAVDKRRKDGLPVSTFGLAVVRELRAAGAPTDQIAMELRSEAHRLKALEEILTPSPEKRDDMLRDALEIIEVAESIFEHQGCSDDVVAEALRSASDDMELFEAASAGHTGARPTDMAYIRAQYRIKLALALADFRKKHPDWKPLRTENEAEGTEPAKVAS
jgi:hypothetical protein